SRARSAFTWRTVGVFCPILVLLCYWTSYSEGVVSATSPHSLSPPMNILTALAILTAVVVPAHHGIRARRGWALGLLFGALVLGVWLIGKWVVGIRAMILGARDFPAVPVWAALLAAAALYPLVRRALERSEPLAAHEAIAVYAMLMVGSLVTSYATAHFLLPTMVAARYYVSIETKWKKWLP